MPTNPGNIVRIRSRNGGRASVYESNMWAQKWSGGLFSGNGVRQNTSADMNVLVGGATTTPDVVIGQNPGGYNIALDIVGTQTIAITKPASNSRITAIIAYTNDLSLTSADAGTTGSPSSCGLIVVNGATSASPVAPTDSDIRAAITSDGATGSQATYCVIATILVASTTTTVTNTLISTRRAQLATAAIADGAITSDKVDSTTLPFAAFVAIPYDGSKTGAVQTITTGIKFGTKTLVIYWRCFNVSVSTPGSFSLITPVDFTSVLNTPGTAIVNDVRVAARFGPSADFFVTGSDVAGSQRIAGKLSNSTKLVEVWGQYGGASSCYGTVMVYALI